MKDIKLRPGSAWDAILVISLLSLLFSAWLIYSAPKPTAKKTNNTRTSWELLQKETVKLEASLTEAEDRIKDRTWDVTAEIFGSRVLDQLTHEADKNHLQLSGFRVGKPIVASILLEAPFTVIIKGSFMDVVKFLGGLEDPDSKIAVSQLRIVSDGAADHVTATLGLTGFLSVGGK